MTQSYQLGFTPFATPLQATRFYAERENQDLLASFKPDNTFTVVGFRQKKGRLMLVTPEGVELDWAQETCPRKLVQYLPWSANLSGRVTPWILTSQLSGEERGTVRLSPDANSEAEW